MVIIGLNAPKGSGKTVVADCLCTRHKFMKLSFGDPLKHALTHIFDLDNSQLWGNKKEEIDEFWGITPREIMQYVGTDLLRNNLVNKYPNIGTNIWVILFEKKIQKLLKENKDINIVIDDIRFPNEINIIKKYGGHIVQINRPLMILNDSHESENALKNIQVSHMLINYENELNKLYEQIDELLEKI